MVSRLSLTEDVEARGEEFDAHDQDPHRHFLRLGVHLLQHQMKVNCCCNTTLTFAGTPHESQYTVQRLSLTRKR